MQTFLPYPDFEQTAQSLDYRRLGKQRLECKQILNALQRGEGGWVNHPATKMWSGYEDALKLYMNVCIKEWKRRGYKNTMKLNRVPKKIKYPRWLGLAEFHSSHRAALLEKDYQHYKKFKWKEKPQLAYIWPIKIGE